MHGFSEQQFNSFVESTIDAIITIDARGDIVFCNQSAERMFGYKAENLPGCPVSRLIPERYHPAHNAGIKKLREDRDILLPEKILRLRGLKSGGKEFPVELSILTWQADGKRYFSAILRDTIEKERYPASIEQLHQKNNLILKSAGDGICGAEESPREAERQIRGS